MIEIIRTGRLRKNYQKRQSNGNISMDFISWPVFLFLNQHIRPDERIAVGNEQKQQDTNHTEESARMKRRDAPARPKQRRDDPRKERDQRQQEYRQNRQSLSLNGICHHIRHILHPPCIADK
ncbi:MAG: hypothetical protein SPD11_07535 [Sphaerochaetaceae bacterium]|nr:hypothetical protein [Sphaerochaetaceae bacterium]